MSDDFDLPITVTSAGAQPQDPVDIQTQLIAQVSAQQPGYTTNLPGILIEDMSSTAVNGIALCDQGRVEVINSLSPNGANQFALMQRGQLSGIIYGVPTRTSVLVVFAGTVGYVIPDGLLVGDGSKVYQVKGGGVIRSGGTSSPINCIAIDDGSWGVPIGTVTLVQTSVPSTVNLSCNNPTAGTPGTTAAESISSYRARVMQADLAVCTGGPKLIKTLVGNVAGVLKNTVSVQAASGGIRVIVAVGSADIYEIAYAIFQAIGDPSVLLGSSVSSGRNVTVSLIDPPNTYPIVFVNSPAQTLTMTVTWNTDATNFTGGGAFPSNVQPPLVAYLNAIASGAPINELTLNELFKDSVSALLDPEFLSRLVYSISIAGSVTAPGTGTFLVSGDVESYFSTALDGSGITVTQG